MVERAAADERGRDEIAVDWPDGAVGEGAEKDPVTPPEEEDEEAPSEEEMDETVEETFPASDPPAW